MQSLRDNPDCALEEIRAHRRRRRSGLSAALGFDPDEDVAAPYILRGLRPPLAVLREQGVNGQLEMAAAFHQAGFACVDVHMSDIIAGRVGLDRFRRACGLRWLLLRRRLGGRGGLGKVHSSQPASAGAVPGLLRAAARPSRSASATAARCSVNLHELIPGADHWPHFVRNRSEQFEARLVMVEVTDCPSVLLNGMAGSRLPIVVAHGEGRAEFRDARHLDRVKPQVALRYLENAGGIAERYPANPNGSPEGITGLTTKDGRVTVIMPHPERLFRALQYSWRPDEWTEDGPWMRLFRNARVWVD